MKRIWSAIAAAAFLGLAGCAPALTVGATSASDLRAGAYRSYAWDLPDQFPAGDPRLDNNPFFVQELTGAIDGELRKQGLYRGAGMATDLVVHVHMNVRERVNVFEADVAAGYDQSAYGRGSQVQQYDEGTIVVDVAEATGKKLIWRGWVQTDLTGVIGNNLELAKRIRAGITKVFAQFPAQAVGR